jgi:hypothetical protein
LTGNHYFILSITALGTALLWFGLSLQVWTIFSSSFVQFCVFSWRRVEHCIFRDLVSFPWSLFGIQTFFIASCLRGIYSKIQPLPGARLILLMCPEGSEGSAYSLLISCVSASIHLMLLVYIDRIDHILKFAAI